MWSTQSIIKTRSFAGNYRRGQGSRVIKRLGIITV
jgi:hypothetical protein